MNKIIHGDCLKELKKLKDNSVDLLCTDPPYGYSFMGKDWDKAVPSVEIWKECLRVLKPGAFAFVMSAPRQDVLSQMIVRIGQAGFDTNYTSIYWTYASGFPKAANVAKLADKRNGTYERGALLPTSRKSGPSPSGAYGEGVQQKFAHSPKSKQAKALEGSYGGFQPKPAVEVIIVAMKPLSEKTYVDQALKNGKGITWFEDARVPYKDASDMEMRTNLVRGVNVLGGNDFGGGSYSQPKESGRFPANLLVSGNVLDDHSRFFDLDEWAKTLPFLIVPKAAKSEKKLDGFACCTIRDVCKGESTAQVALLLKDMFGSVATSLSIDVSGDNISVRCPTDFTSTIRTTISGIIASKTWNSLMPSPTNASTKGASSKTTGGTNLVASAKSSSALTTTIGIFQRRVGSATDDVKRAIYASLLKLNDSANWSDAHSTHPTTKPLKLMCYLITLGSRAGDTVLEPFAGSGTTCLAAKMLGRQFIGMEMSPEYVEIARARIAAYDSNAAKLPSMRKRVQAPPQDEQAVLPFLSSKLGKGKKVRAGKAAQSAPSPL